MLKCAHPEVLAPEQVMFDMHLPALTIMTVGLIILYEKKNKKGQIRGMGI